MPTSISMPPTSTAGWVAPCRSAPGLLRSLWESMPTAAASYSACRWDSESEGFWKTFIGSLKELGLTGVKLVVSDAHVGLTKAIRRMFQGCCWQGCRVHFARNLLQRIPKAHQGMVTAALRLVFSQEGAVGLVERWDDLAASLAERSPRTAEL
jgi:putative transposase